MPSNRNRDDLTLGQSEARVLLLSCPSDGIAAALRTVLLGRRCDGWLTIAAAAELADTSVRSLQRRLAAEGWTFLKLVDQTRFELAQELLRGELSLRKMTQELGYSETQNFIRAFRRWSGKTPDQYRRGFNHLK